MRILERLKAYGRIARNARRNRTTLVRWLIRRPAILGAVNAYELAVLASNRVEPRVKYVAVVKASAMVGCPF